MFDPVSRLADEIEVAVNEPAFQRDERFLEILLSLMKVLNAYFDSEVRGLATVPEDPVLLVGNHSGGMLTPDTSALFSAWYEERGLESRLTGLALDAAFAVPGLKSIMRKMGEVPANMENAGRALEEGSSVIVYPGGDHEAFRPWSDRNRIDFDNRTGFIRLALERQVPVIPVVGHGGHETTIVLARGAAFARFLGLERLRMHMFPLMWKVPWGLSLAGTPALPLPAKITLQVCRALDWSQFRPEDANDPQVVQHCYAEITAVMQRTLTALAKERPYPVLNRIGRLFPPARWAEGMLGGARS